MLVKTNELDLQELVDYSNFLFDSYLICYLCYCITICTMFFRTQTIYHVSEIYLTNGLTFKG